MSWWYYYLLDDEDWNSLVPSKIGVKRILLVIIAAVVLGVDPFGKQEVAHFIDQICQFTTIQISTYGLKCGRCKCKSTGPK
eukprot:scaffold3438_cov64-Attheya_sp.AAC.3